MKEAPKVAPATEEAPATEAATAAEDATAAPVEEEAKPVNQLIVLAASVLMIFLRPLRRQRRRSAPRAPVFSLSCLHLSKVRRK